jgi:hypothetical protein
MAAIGQGWQLEEVVGNQTNLVFRVGPLASRSLTETNTVANTSFGWHFYLAVIKCILECCDDLKSLF